LELSNHHGTIFKRVKNEKVNDIKEIKHGELCITFRMKAEVEKESLIKYFWCLKPVKLKK
jgi:hypothetical protein